MQATADLLTLALLPGVGPRTVRELALRGPLATSLRHPDSYADLLSEPARRRLSSGEAQESADLEWRTAARLGVRIVGWDEPEYPALLRRIYDPPPVIYARGTLLAEEPHPVAVVGARAATPAGRALAFAMARDLAQWGATIVSGLARGVDTAAHQGALAAPGRTVAVLGSAMDRLYPAENDTLARQIAERGAVVSEFPFGTGARPEHFPRRNRLIAGWARAVVVAQAARRSGALNTARIALEEGRDVLAVPGHPADPTHEGTNALLREGAGLVRDARDVAEELGMVAPGPKVPEAADPLLAALEPDAPYGVEELQRRTGLETAELLARLSQLELAHRVRRLPGALFVRHH